MIKRFLFFVFALPALTAVAQKPPSYTSADIFLQLKKLKVLGSVLYIAAHPDDENTRLLAYLSKEKLLRTGYLSLTRGDGGQNLIGDEQGIELGLIRTQELLAARRIDGAEQYFTRAYDFGFSKNTDEALRIWGKDKILSDVVWVIRNFRPDIIITRFPPDNRAGHGHHSASAVLAREAFTAAADPKIFPEQFQYGVTPWKTKRIFWNTFNFGGTNTTSEDQLKIDVGVYNAILGKSYGEIAAESRSQHKSQGFGVPASRGTQIEYFSLLEGAQTSNDPFEGLSSSWSEIDQGDKILNTIDNIIKNYSLSNPELSVPGLVQLHKQLLQSKESYLRNIKLNEIQQIIEAASGLWLETSASNRYAVQGDSLRLNININNRSGINTRITKISIPGSDSNVNLVLDRNKNYAFFKTIFIPSSMPMSQPYWLQEKMSEGSFNVKEQMMIGKAADTSSLEATFYAEIEGQQFIFKKPIRYKYTDPVRGEMYQPLIVVPPLQVTIEPQLLIFNKNRKAVSHIYIKVTCNRDINNTVLKVSRRLLRDDSTKTDSNFSLNRGHSRVYTFAVDNTKLKKSEQENVLPFVTLESGNEEQLSLLNMATIRYDHIPEIHYFTENTSRLLNIDLKTVGKKIGYIEGAGDRVPQALEEMGYEVKIIHPKDITPENLGQFDAVITGIRAYNVNDFLGDCFDVLMEYVKGGGNLIVQYNTNSQVGPVKTKIGPYPFNISRNRITDEKAPVNILLPDHPVINYPNKITSKDFEGWVQERGIYFADQVDAKYETPLSMHDPDEPDQKGSLLIADYGKGKFVYTGLVFFRELPAGVPGAYRLLANIIALNKRKGLNE